MGWRSQGGIRRNVPCENSREVVMQGSARDLVFALRRLRAAPVFATFSIVTLALGIGVTTAIYSVVQAAVSPPSGIYRADGILNVQHSPRGGFPQGAFSWPDYLDLSRHQTALDDLSAWAFFRQAYTANGRAEVAYAELVSGAYFKLLGVNAALGRLLQPAHDAPGAPSVAVISYQVWQRVFDGTPDAVGRTVMMNGRQFEIVGVTPKAFRGLFNNGLIATWVSQTIATSDVDRIGFRSGLPRTARRASRRVAVNL
jgi:putative ABC transport system permease protein